MPTWIVQLKDGTCEITADGVADNNGALEFYERSGEHLSTLVIFSRGQWLLAQRADAKIEFREPEPPTGWGEPKKFQLPFA